MINIHTLNEQTYQDLRYNFLVDVEESGDPKEIPYLDSDNIPTIGVGFNLREEIVLNAVVSELGLKINDQAQLGVIERSYRDQILTAANASYSNATDLRNALNQIMLIRANDTAVPGTKRTTFAFSNEAEIRSVFDILIVTYETQTASRIPGITDSAERVALLSLEWAGILDDSENLRTAINEDNRAEAWYEIRYQSNGEALNGTAKRRYYESELFGLYDDEGSVQDDESLSIYAMYTAHRDQILSYDSTYGSQVAAANADYSAASITIRNRDESFAPAHDFLIDKYASGLDIEIAEILAGKVDTQNEISITAQDATNDLIFGRNLADQITSGDGNDVLIGGDGADSLDGGDGLDYASYQDSDAAIQIDLGALSFHGGAAEGDTLSNIEGIIGSKYADKIKGNSQDNILLGNDGNDTLDGGDGDDVLYGGKGNDTFVAGKNDAVIGQTYSQGNEYIVGLISGGDVLAGEEGMDTYDLPWSWGLTYEQANSYMSLGQRLDIRPTEGIYAEGGAPYGGEDSLVMGPGVKLGDISIARSVDGLDLIITVKNNGVATGDAVTLKNWFNSYGNYYEKAATLAHAA